MHNVCDGFFENKSESHLRLTCRHIYMCSEAEASSLPSQDESERERPLQRPHPVTLPPRRPHVSNRYYPVAFPPGDATPYLYPTSLIRPEWRRHRHSWNLFISDHHGRFFLSTSQPTFQRGTSHHLLMGLPASQRKEP